MTVSLDSSSATAPLVGRESEVAQLRHAIDRSAEQGSAVLVRGAPGIGKSALLRETAGYAGDRGLQVLSTVGVRSEAQVPFSSLHQLLRPLVGRAGALPAAQRDALLAALGTGEPATPDFFRLALAVLDLLAGAARERPMLVVADDAHWLDRSTWDVLAFVARRVATDPIVMLVAARDAEDAHLLEAALPELRLPALDDDGARRLLDRHAPGLAPAVREQLLAEAAGNPLALVELPIAAGRLRDGVSPPAWLPLTARLERAFAARVGELPTL